MATLDTGTLVKARGREWVVLPESTCDLYMLRPLGGLDEEVTALIPTIEDISSATFATPDPSQPGDHNACRLLRDAARLSTRAAAGPFRSFGRIAVEPRPYQLVPLLMAMRLDPVRMLIADDVGIGKTIEACLVARELLDRGEVTRLAVLCPPHLAEQWQRELRDKFHIDAELILASTINRLERGIKAGGSVFDRYPYVIVSTDYIKSPRHRDEFIRACPELVIVDEAHSCTLAGPGRARQQRWELVKALSEDSERHLILVTATPHSGNEEAFRSLLSLLDDKFGDLPTDLEKKERESIRRELARHLVQRRRADILEYDRKLGTKTSFPDRDDREETYKLSPEYKKLFQKALRFAGELVADESGSKRHHRVRWWSALALLRALASSPAAAAATLSKRAETAGAETEEDADELGRRAVLDQEELDAIESIDITPGSDASEESGEKSISDRLKRLASEARKLEGVADAKLQKAKKLIGDLVKDGHNPIVFCRFIDTAVYVADELRGALKKAEVISVTGLLPPAEREKRIEELPEHKPRVLVCTDCLSEGVNLQDHFDAVVHYDLAWNPTRHEQREGRVDRFGQPKPKVRVLTYFGTDNQVDGVVLDVLLRKHKQIRSDLGVSVAIPGTSEEVVEALFHGILLRAHQGASQELLPGAAEWLQPKREELHARWDEAKEREKVSRSRFAQHMIKTDEVAKELALIREAIGAGPTVKQFVTDVLHLAGVPSTAKANDHLHVEVGPRTDRAIRSAIGRDEPFTGRFDLPVEEGVLHLARTHPVVEGVASFVLETALDEVQAEDQPPIARRCGLIKTGEVNVKTSLLLVRLRYHLVVSRRGAPDRALLAEEIRSLAFVGTADAPVWLEDEAADRLLAAKPSANVPLVLVNSQLEHLVGSISELEQHLAGIAKRRGEVLLDAHTRIRQSARMAGQVRVEPVLPTDLLGCFILLPETG